MSKALTTHWQPPTLGDVAAGGAEQVPDGPLAPEGVQVGGGSVSVSVSADRAGQ